MGRIIHPFRGGLTSPSVARRRAPGGAAPGGGPVLPITANLVAHYKFNTGITEATGVSQWDDQSGNGYNLAQATTTKQPANSSGIITFDGSDDTLFTTAFGIGAPHTVCLLMRVDTWANLDKIWDSSAAIQLLMSPTDTNIRQFAGSYATNRVMTTGVWYAVACAGDVAGNAYLKIGSAGTRNSGYHGTNTGTNFYLANTAVGGAAAISVKEVAVYSDEKNDADMTSILEYMEAL